jgi:hypothetical protein
VTVIVTTFRTDGNYGDRQTRKHRPETGDPTVYFPPSPLRSSYLTTLLFRRPRNPTQTLMAPNTYDGPPNPVKPQKHLPGLTAKHPVTIPGQNNPSAAARTGPKNVSPSGRSSALAEQAPVNILA